MPRKYPVNKPIRFSLIGLLILFFLYSLTQFLPVFVDLLEANSLYSAIGALGFGLFLLTYSATTSYYAWKLDEANFLEWDQAQQWIAGEKKVPSSTFSILWPTRVLTLFIALLSLVVIAAAIFWIFKVFPK